MKRLLASLGVAVVLALGVTVTLPPAAASATISPLAPDPINILPSVVKAGTKGSAAQTYAMWNSILINVLQQAQRSKEFWAIVDAQKTGTATAQQITLLDKMKKGFKIPAFKPAALVKGAGPTAVALFGFEAGFTIGDGVLQLFGIDRNGTVCQESANAGEWLAFVGMADCTEFKKNAEMVANLGFTPGLFGAKSCQTGNPNNCIWLVRGGKSNSVNNSMYCFKKSGASLSGNPLGSFSARPTPASLNWIASSASDYTDICGGTIGSPDAAYVYHLKSYGDLLGYSIYDPANPNPTPVPVESTGTNPDRNFKCVVLGSNGTSYTQVSPTFKETDAVIPDPKCPDLPPGVTPERITITEEGGGEEHVIYKEDATPESKGWRTTYPECAQGTCMLDLLKNGKSCFISPGPCLDWFDDPQKQGTYECRYGGKVVSLSECNVYGPSFNGDPTVTGHPDTGKPLGNPKPDAKDPKTFDNKVQDPTKNRVCHPTGWGMLNPIEWVLRPVQCALEWAFVPRPATIANFNNTLSGAVNTSLLGNVDTFVGAFSAPFERASGNCQGPPFRIQFDFGQWGGMDQTYHPLNSCTGVMSVLALFSYAASGGVIMLGASLAAIRYFAGIFGFAAFGYGAIERSSSRVQFKGDA